MEKHLSSADQELSFKNKKIKTVDTNEKTSLTIIDNTDNDPSILINSDYINSQFIKKFHQTYQNKQEFNDPATLAKTYTSPFPITLLPNIFSSDFLKSIRSELEADTFYHKSNDLYEFYQSEDLKLTKSPNLIKLRETIYSDLFVKTISELTGVVDLDSTPDLSAHQYIQGNYLLCHDDDIKDDDNMHGRRIAFIIYLVDEDWCEDDGGKLDLFNIDNLGQPNQIIRSIIPSWNTMVFFELSPTSYHQVSEVLTNSKIRFSISGWFHGPLNTRLSIAKFIPPIPKVYNINELVNPVYLTKEGTKNILKALRNEASIELHQFLQQDVYNKLVKSLDKDAEWNDDPVGPPFIRKYHLIKRPTIDEEGSEDADTPYYMHIYKFFLSDTFKSFISEISCFNTLAISSEIRRFQCGDYTLIHDHAMDKQGLDVILSCIVHEWNINWQGGTHYVSQEEELLTISPKPNTLSIVVRDAS
nr:2232_t:CDS:2 [Entrophospora candida]